MELNTIDKFKRLSEIHKPVGTELTLDLGNGQSVTVHIKEHHNEYDDPLEQKYTVKSNELESLLHLENLTVTLSKIDADNLPLGNKMTVQNIAIQNLPT